MSATPELGEQPTKHPEAVSQRNPGSLRDSLDWPSLWLESAPCPLVSGRVRGGGSCVFRLRSHQALLGAKGAFGSLTLSQDDEAIASLRSRSAMIRVIKKNRRRPDESERRRDSRPHDGNAFECLLPAKLIDQCQGKLRPAPP
jgi:hypothetical protein